MFRNEVDPYVMKTYESSTNWYQLFNLLRQGTATPSGSVLPDDLLPKSFLLSRNQPGGVHLVNLR